MSHTPASLDIRDLINAGRLVNAQAPKDIAGLMYTPRYVVAGHLIKPMDIARSVGEQVNIRGPLDVFGADGFDFGFSFLPVGENSL